MTDYRKLYSQSYGITWDNDLEIHHIDRNRENNELSNLVLLPGSLHKELHKCLNELIALRETSVTDLIEDMSSDVLRYGLNYSATILGDLLQVLSKCERWGFLKSVEYKECDGSPIGHITKDTMKWIG